MIVLSIERTGLAKGTIDERLLMPRTVLVPV